MRAWKKILEEPEQAVHLLKRSLADPIGAALALRIRRHRLSYLGVDALLDLRHEVKRIERDRVPGVVLEAGVALGGSAVMLSSSKDPARELLLYDVYGMIPAPSQKDGEDVHRRYEVITSGASRGIRGDTYYGYRDDLREFVEHVLTTFGYPPDEHRIQLIEGLYEDTLHPPKVALAHVDADWYASVKVCLDRIWPKLSSGGVMIFDDYYHWSGCRKAVDEWLKDRTDAIALRRSRLQVRRR